VNDGFERMSWSNLKVLFQHFPIGTEETHEKTSVRIAALRNEI
jgi:calcineurin-like phosphoesterase family protein